MRKNRNDVKLNKTALEGKIPNRFDNEFRCVDMSPWMNGEYNGGYLDTQGTWRFFPHLCFAKGKVGVPFDCFPSINTTIYTF